MTKKPVGLKDFKIEMVAIDLLKPYPQNPKAHPEAQIAKIAQSIKEYGIAKNIVINADNEIICGHGSVLAYQKLGVGVVPCRRMTHLSPAQEKGLRLSDNRTAESAWFPETLALELKALEEMDFDLGLTGFDLSELAEFGGGGELGFDLGLTGFELGDMGELGELGIKTDGAPTPEAPGPGKREKGGGTVTCPECGHKFSVLKGG